MTFESVAKILAEYKDCDVNEIKPETTLADLELDSLDTVEIVTTIEDEFSITMDISGGVKTVSDLVELVEKAKA